MTTPGDVPVDGSQTGAVILLELGKQSTLLAVMDTKLNALISAKDDHEKRLRELRAEVPPKLTERLSALEGGAQQRAGVRDLAARWLGLLAVIAATTGAVAAFVHH